MDKEQLLKIEKGFWVEGAEYYDNHITDDAVFVFPGIRLGKQDGVSSVGEGARWNSLELSNMQVIPITDKVAVLTYHATGLREGKDPYNGNITTVYRLENGEPKMIFHQHTPDPE